MNHFLVDFDKYAGGETGEGLDIGKDPDPPGLSFQLRLDQPLDAVARPPLSVAAFAKT